MGNPGDLLLCREDAILMNDNMTFLPSYAKVSKNDFVVSLGEIKKATNFDFVLGQVLGFVMGFCLCKFICS